MPGNDIKVADARSVEALIAKNENLVWKFTITVDLTCPCLIKNSNKILKHFKKYIIFCQQTYTNVDIRVKFHNEMTFVVTYEKINQ